MGGYGSGNIAIHPEISQYHQLDIKNIKQLGWLTSGVHKGTLTWRMRQGKKVIATSVIGCEVHRSREMTLRYSYAQDGKKQAVHQSILLLMTDCHLGGVRFWFQSPCCQKRVRILYLGDGAIRPMCRTCLHLNYGSQRANRIEQHKRYERWLLEQGYLWTTSAWFDLKEHYLSWEETDSAFIVGRYRAAMRECKRLLSTARLIEHMARAHGKIEEEEQAQATIVDILAVMSQCKKEQKRAA